MINSPSRFLHRLRFRTKITLGMSTMLVFCGLGVGLLLSVMSSNALLDEGKKRGMALSSSLAYRLAEPLLAMDFLQMKNLLDNVNNQYDDIVYVFLTDASTNVLAHTFSGGFPIELLDVNRGSGQAQPVLLATEIGLVYDFSIKVTLGEKNLGLVRLGLSRRDIDAKIRHQLVISLFSTMGVVGLGIVLALWYSHTVTFRLNRLRRSVEEIVRGNLDVQAGFALEKYCWEIMDCNHKQCPAYGDTQRRCWYLPGTLCPDCRDKEYPLKIESCRQCSVYRHNFGDELQDLAEAFDAMAVTLKNHIQELTDREKTIIRQQGLLKTIMNVTPDFITLQDKNLVYTFAGKAFCDYFGLREEDIVGKTDVDLFDEQDAKMYSDENRSILETGQPLIREAIIRGPDEQRWFHVVKVAVFEQNDSIIGILFTARDITMLKKFQEQLIHSQKMEDLGRLAGGVAHEINTPLGIILGYTQLLMDDIEDKELLEGLRIIERQTKACRKIVADLLGFSRHSQAVSETVNINESIEQVIKLVEHAFFMNRIRVGYAFDEKIPALTGDQEKLKQVWLNLLNNAADAIGQDGVIFVQSKFLAEEKKIIISMTDTGRGIAEEHLSKIFDPFFTTKQVGKGTGLGLSVSFGIIKDHGGRIYAVSPPPAGSWKDDNPDQECSGPGAVFIVELPIS